MIELFIYAQRYITLASLKNQFVLCNLLVYIQTYIVFKYDQNTVVQIHAVYFYIVKRFIVLYCTRYSSAYYHICFPPYTIQMFEKYDLMIWQ